MIQPNDTAPDWDTPLDQTTPPGPSMDPAPLSAPWWIGAGLLFGVLVILLIVRAMIS